MIYSKGGLCWLLRQWRIKKSCPKWTGFFYWHGCWTYAQALSLHTVHMSGGEGVQDAPVQTGGFMIIIRGFFLVGALAHPIPCAITEHVPFSARPKVIPSGRSEEGFLNIFGLRKVLSMFWLTYTYGCIMLLWAHAGLKCIMPIWSVR